MVWQDVEDASWTNLQDEFASVAHTLESLDLTVAANDAIITQRDWLREVTPLDSLATFDKLKDFTIFQEALYSKSTRIKNAPSTKLTPNLEILCIRRPTILGRETLVQTLTEHRNDVRYLNKLTLHYEPGLKLPKPEKLRRSSQCRTLQHLGIRICVCWST